MVDEKGDLSVRHTEIATNGIRLHVTQDGAEAGPLVILLHGFPEYWYGWRHQIPALAGAGFRVWAPDQRGYNLSEKPGRVTDYRIDSLARDVIGLIDAAGRQKALLVGHDWGGVVGWRAAAEYPERIDRMVIINAPQGSVMQKHLRRSRDQRRKSLYMLFFQIPGLPEALSRRREWAWARAALQKSSRPGTFTDQELDLYCQAWSQPGAFTAMLNWYRAAFRHPPPPPRNKGIHSPTLVIWGARDRFLGLELAGPSTRRCEEGHLAIFEEASHWVHHEEPGEVNRLIAGFFRGEDPGSLLR